MLFVIGRFSTAVKINITTIKNKKTLMLPSNVAREKYKGKHNFVLLRGACSSHILKFRLEGKYE
jgi:hypothetical protein